MPYLASLFANYVIYDHVHRLSAAHALMLLSDWLLSSRYKCAG